MTVNTEINELESRSFIEKILIFLFSVTSDYDLFFIFCD